MTLRIHATFCPRLLIVLASVVAMLNFKIDSASGFDRVAAARIAAVENGLDPPALEIIRAVENEYSWNR